MKKILVIEDDHEVRDNLKTLLEEESYRVFCAPSGKEGIQSAKEIKPDLIICDVMMEDIDGYEVFKNLSEYPDTAVIPFIFLTARAGNEDLRLGMELGADDYLFKPFQAETLLRAVQIRLSKYELLRAEFVEKNGKDETHSGRKKKLDVTDKIFLKVNSQIVFITVGDIKLITAENQYSNIHLKEGKSYLLRMPLSKWEEKLSESNFYRIHRSTIININFIDKIDKWFNNSLKLYIKNIKEPFLVSRSYTRKFESFE